MAIGIVDSSDFDQELDRLSNKKIIIAEIETIKRGRDKVEVPEVVREIIGTDAIENGNSSAKAIARAFDISDSSVSAYKNGSTSTASYNEPNPELRKSINSVREKLATKAKNRLNQALNNITKEKLENAKLRDVASVALAMSTVIKQMENTEEDKGHQTNFIFYAPKAREESSYETITVQE